ncbi:hypothetical protein [Sphingobacterium sp. SGL-16]|uniref:hypothetical protein n=1 Tax=Sphingobacterium sp. SGL-16 TaxID=2710883 RepID=UPI0013ECD637|nr:hypothetical protein [Sphingobacterium sp. SGL-16]NGM73859.1 hypothetical protein [Sphingobacterium sp. SGL-16]
MKKNYIPPGYSVTIIDIENSLCNTSSLIQPSIKDSDYLQEWEELPDDERKIQW